MVEPMTDRLTEAWARTDRIFEILAPGAWLAQPIALRHPFIFYLGHLPAFAWNHVGGELLGRPAFNAASAAAKPSTPTSAAACDGALPARHVSPGRSQGKPVKMWPRSHSAAEKIPANTRTFQALRGLAAR